MIDSGPRQSPALGTNEVPVAPIALSIVGVITWLVFILLYALYWSAGYSPFRNIVVTIVSFLIAGLLIGLMWMTWHHLSGERR